MKYTLEIDINAPLETVLAKFDNLDNLKEWQAGFIAHEHMEGDPGREGAKTKLKYVNRNREVVLVETVFKKNLPEEFIASYDAKGASSMIKNRFEVLGPQETRWHFFTEFTASGIYKLMMILMPGVFKKQSKKFLEGFKQFAERS